MIEFEEAGFSYGRDAVLRDVTLTLDPGLVPFPASGRRAPARPRSCGSATSTWRRPRAQVRLLRPADRAAVIAMRLPTCAARSAWCTQDCRFLDHLPLIENIALPLRVSGIAPADARRRPRGAARVGRPRPTGRGALPAELSGGERQRAALARAVILSPEVILADEPTGSVDWEMALRLLALLVELNRMGKTVLVATHDPNLVRAARTRVRGAGAAAGGRPGRAGGGRGVTARAARLAPRRPAAPTGVVPRGALVGGCRSASSPRCWPSSRCWRWRWRWRPGGWRRPGRASSPTPRRCRSSRRRTRSRSRRARRSTCCARRPGCARCGWSTSPSRSSCSSPGSGRTSRWRACRCRS